LIKKQYLCKYFFKKKFIVLKYNKFILDNGLRVIVHEDESTPLAAFNILYEVGTRDEAATHTGLAHLFEHLMFSGSENVKNIDNIVQNAGGENNAFTNNDHTNYHEIFPAQNIETAFWIESDRMSSLTLSKKALDTQKKVVVEEFKETTLNEPFGDMWHHLSAMLYDSHPYRWPVIGLTPEHIERVDSEIAMSFYRNFYHPNNAIVAISGNVKTEDMKVLSEKWFGTIPSPPKTLRAYPKELAQTEEKRMTIKGKTPVEAIFIAFRMCNRLGNDFYAIDLMSDILSNGQSSRFYLNLLKDQRLFSTVDAFISGTLDDGAFIIEGKLNQDCTLEAAEAAIWTELNTIKNTLVSDYELQKTKNQVESALIFSESGILNKAINFCFYESIGNIELINSEFEQYEAVQATDIQQVANDIFQKEKACTVIYSF
jgi:zinc protease